MRDHTITDSHSHNIFHTVGLFVSVGHLVCTFNLHARTSDSGPEFLLVTILTKSNSCLVLVTGKLYFPDRYEIMVHKTKGRGNKRKNKQKKKKKRDPILMHFAELFFLCFFYLTTEIHINNFEKLFQ